MPVFTMPRAASPPRHLAGSVHLTPPRATLTLAEPPAPRQAPRPASEVMNEMVATMRNGNTKVAGHLFAATAGLSVAGMHAAARSLLALRPFGWLYWL